MDDLYGGTTTDLYDLLISSATEGNLGPALEKFLRHAGGKDIVRGLQDALHAAARAGRPAALRVLLRRLLRCANHAETTSSLGLALYSSAKAGHLETVRLLLGVLVRYEYKTELAIELCITLPVAAAAGHPGTARLILDSLVRYASGEQRAYSLRKGLCAGVRSGNEQILQLLLEPALRYVEDKTLLIRSALDVAADLSSPTKRVLVAQVIAAVFHGCEIVEMEVAETVVDPCGICYEPVTRVCRLPCGHSPHSRCIKRWLLEQPTCPFCRRTITFKN
jgi:Ring finger domain